MQGVVISVKGNIDAAFVKSFSVIVPVSKQIPSRYMAQVFTIFAALISFLNFFGFPTAMPPPVLKSILNYSVCNLVAAAATFFETQ